MASRSTLSYGARANDHSNPLARRLFEIAERKKTNISLSADLTTTSELLAIADALGPYIAVLKTHIDIVSDFGPRTIDGLTALSSKHDFLIFEDRKFVDIGNTAQKQYKGGALRIFDWAHLVNASVLAGEGIIQALDEVIAKSDGAKAADKGILILAEMTSKGSLATGEYTKRSVEIAKIYQRSVIGFVATRELSSFEKEMGDVDGDAPIRQQDFVIFTTGVNLSSVGDSIGQQYQTPTSAIEGGADFLITGRGIYASSDPVAAVRRYQDAGWSAYLNRVKDSA